MSKTKVGLIYGGPSVEHAVSIISATSIRAALDPEAFEVIPIGVDLDGKFHCDPEAADLKGVLQGSEVRIPHDRTSPALISADGQVIDIDIFFPIIHGNGGEDGTLQGLLELAAVPYVGSSVLGAAIQMDKDITKQLLQANGIAVVPWQLARSFEIYAQADEIARKAIEQLTLPLFIKPATLGSSVGIQKANNFNEVIAALRNAGRYDTKILIEKSINGREIEIAVLGNDHPKASIPGEICAAHEFYDYEAKYQPGATEEICPAQVDADITKQAQDWAVKAHRILHLDGYSRTDMIIDQESKELYVLETNTIPGMTPTSLLPQAAKEYGLSFSGLLDRLIELGLQAHKK